MSNQGYGQNYTDPKTVNHNANGIPDADVDDLPQIQQLSKRLAEAEARQAAAVENSWGVQTRIRTIAEAAQRAERELRNIDAGQPGLAVDALLDADVQTEFAKQEKRADELRALLRCYKLAPSLQSEAADAAMIVRNAVEAVALFAEKLAAEKMEQKRLLAKQKMTPR